eukprot:TRINITY_DN8316_c0_g1_i1.p1 TRINITY_DN8316_c0_g1~~TRINITY_DN8316_c0_g1_i1.p1  ORF type:complete len:210 (-),score=26.95 TRINITY_DN8316_c0_g1_i1:268-816(-)
MALMAIAAAFLARGAAADLATVVGSAGRIGSSAVNRSQDDLDEAAGMTVSLLQVKQDSPQAARQQDEAGLVTGNLETAVSRVPCEKNDNSYSCSFGTEGGLACLWCPAVDNHDGSLSNGQCIMRGAATPAGMKCDKLTGCAVYKDRKNCSADPACLYCEVGPYEVPSCLSKEDAAGEYCPPN